MKYEHLNYVEFEARYRAGERKFAHVRLPLHDVSGQTIENCEFIFSDLGYSKVRGCTFRRCSFYGSSWHDSTFEGTIFDTSTFRMATLNGVAVSGGKFDSCDMTSSRWVGARLTNVVLTHSSLSHAGLDCAYLSNVDVEDTYLDDCTLGSTIFRGSDLSAFCNANRLVFSEGAIVDWSSIARSVTAGRLEDLLVESGMPSIFAHYAVESARALEPNMLQNLLCSTFISYGAPDASFARRLRDHLVAAGVRTFMFETDAVFGERLYNVMRDGVNAHDRVILICSAQSLQRNGVMNEIQETLAREARDGGATYLIPLTLDDYVFTSTSRVASILRDRVVGDFRPTLRGDNFEEAFQRLLKSLRFIELGRRRS